MERGSVQKEKLVVYRKNSQIEKLVVGKGGLPPPELNGIPQRGQATLPDPETFLLDRYPGSSED
jgi:hypothetical protein